MKSLTGFLLLTLLATAGLAQVGAGSPVTVTVACPDDRCHVAPVFVGEGGFVGEAAEGVDMVDFIIKCGSVVTTGSVKPDSEGIVRQLFTTANGYTCAGKGGTLEIDGLMDGGWYWINDNMNSAVSSLVAKDTLSNDTITPTDPGGLMLTATDYATFVKHEASGRVGIIPHILPVPEPEKMDVCGPRYSSGRYVQRDANCTLGDGRTKITLTGPTASSEMARITNGVVYRDEDETVTVAFALWGNGSGHLSDEPLKGWDITPRSPWKAMPFPADFKVRLLDLPGVDPATEAGITLKDSDLTLSSQTPTPAPATEDATTPQLERGIYEIPQTPPTATTGVNPPKRCVQAVQGNMPLWQAADGKAPIKATMTGVNQSFDDVGILDGLQTWVRSYNSRNARGIRTQRASLYSEDLGFQSAKEVPLVVCRMAGTATTFKGSIDITSPSDLCRAGNRTTAQLQVYATLTSARAQNEDVRPALAAVGRVGSTSAAAIARLDVRCAPASANRGQELVPENPFPVN